MELRAGEGAGPDTPGPPDPPAPVRRSGWWLVHLTLGVAATALAAASPPWRDVLSGTVAVVAVGAAAVGTRWWAPRAGPLWMFVAGGGALVVSGAVRDTTGGTSLGWADVVGAVGYVLLIGGELWLTRLRTRGRQPDNLLDALIVAVAAGLVVWAGLLAPLARDPGVPLADKIGNGLLSTLTLVLVAATVRLAVGPGARSVSYLLLAGSVGAILTTDVLLSLETTGRPFGDLEVLTSMVAFVLGGTAFLHPSLGTLTAAPPVRPGRLTWRRVVALAAALCTAPAVLVAQSVGGRVDVVPIAIGWAMLSALVLARVFALVRREAATAARAARRREATLAVAAATDRYALVRAALRGVRDVVDRADVAVRYYELSGDRLVHLDAIGPDHSRRTGDRVHLDELAPAVRERLGAGPVAHLAAPALTARLSEDTPDALVGVRDSHGHLRGVLWVTLPEPASPDLWANLETLGIAIGDAFHRLELVAEIHRRRADRRFRVLIERSPDVICVVDADMRLRLTSPAVGVLTAAPVTDVDDLRGVPVTEALDGPVAARILERLRNPEAAAGGPVRSSQGRCYDLQVTDLRTDPDIGGWVCHLRDITDRWRAEERFRAMVAHSSDLTIVTDPDGVITYASPAARRVLGLDADELVGVALGTLIAPDEVEAIDRIVASSPRRGRPWRLELHLVATDGAYRTMDVTITDLRDDPAVGGFVLNAHDLTARKELESDLRHRAYTDDLTGLANRAMFQHAVDSALASRSDGVAVLFIDLDDFKLINDTLGHLVGDQLLQIIAGRLRRCVREADVVARLGGDEFGLLVVGSTEGAVAALTGRVLETIAEPVVLAGRQLRITASVGVATAPDAGVTAGELLRNADVAMYVAKEAGKGRWSRFEAGDHEAVFDRMELKADLVRAIDEGRIRLHYQPIVDLATGAPVAVEALARWAHPSRGTVPPGVFIPLAEHSGLIVPLGRQVLDAACAQLAAWDRAGPATANLRVSVNVSVRQLRDPTFVDTVTETVARHGLHPRRVTLELTESLLATGSEEVVARIEALRRAGVGLALDDFGTGYSALAYLHRFRVDTIKIDRTFIAELSRPGGVSVVRTIMDLARERGADTVAEGIEERSQAEILRSLGCGAGQGYLFSGPLPPEQLTRWLAANRPPPAAAGSTHLSRS